MADIRIEKKSGNIWPWIIGIVAVLLIVAGVIYALNREGVIDVGNDTQRDQQQQEQPMNQPPPAQQQPQQQPQSPPPAGP